MEAVVYTGPGELSVADRPAPRPGPGEVVVDVSHVGICGSDLLIWAGGLDRVRPPVVLGHEFSGVVTDPNGCPGVAAGDRVVVEPLLACGECGACQAGQRHVCRRLRLIGIDVDGAAAAYVAVPAARLHRVPDRLSLRDAALAEPTAVAVHMVRRAGVGVADRVLVVGGGPIGALVAAVCRVAGAATLVVSEPNTYRREFLADLGFCTHDPAAQPGGADLAALAGGDGDGRDAAGRAVDGFDVAFELTGVPAGLAAAVGATATHGTVLLGGLPHGPVPVQVAEAVFKELSLVGSRVYTSADMADAVGLIASGAVPAGRLVTREVALPDAVDGAYESLRAGRDDMKILITP
ncbi:zinc-dependent alcohol dehydrogenase [Jiangella asiatica]|nr:alcohol dehydrogenase catalytic domain-containing protein [Jiangella asiatica]